MRDSAARPWLVGLVAVGVVSAVGALALLWYSAELQAQVFAFYQNNPQVTDQTEYLRWRQVSINASVMQNLAFPLFLAAFGSVLALLAVLEVRSRG
ncbi:MAG TPA: hypothetical protein VL294_03535 [Pseudolysinimonas sp.]|jgi:hypothetical protein|nr:hypothetical protein [Pseudolysinimonas sp.]